MNVSDENSEGEQKGQTQPLQYGQPPQIGQPQGQSIHFGQLRPHRPSYPAYVQMTNYIGQGTTKAARRERRVDPRFIARSAIKMFLISIM